MMQNSFLGVRDVVDFWGNTVKEQRCENCGEWVPLVFSCPSCHRMECQPCYQKHSVEEQP